MSNQQVDSFIELNVVKFDSALHGYLSVKFAILSMIWLGII